MFHHNNQSLGKLAKRRLSHSASNHTSGKNKKNVIQTKNCNKSYTLGIKLLPVYAAYADTASYATFILQNQSQQTIECGEAYHITFEKEPDDWYELPNKPGRYRLFYEVYLTKPRKRILLMTEFKLSDQEEEFKTPPQIDIHKKQSNESNVVEIEYIPSE